MDEEDPEGNVPDLEDDPSQDNALSQQPGAPVAASAKGKPAKAPEHVFTRLTIEEVSSDQGDNDTDADTKEDAIEEIPFITSKPEATTSFGHLEEDIKEDGIFITTSGASRQYDNTRDSSFRDMLYTGMPLSP